MRRDLGLSASLIIRYRLTVTGNFIVVGFYCMTYDDVFRKVENCEPKWLTTSIQNDRPKLDILSTSKNLFSSGSSFLPKCRRSNWAEAPAEPGRSYINIKTWSNSKQSWRSSFMQSISNICSSIRKVRYINFVHIVLSTGTSSCENLKRGTHKVLKLTFEPWSSHLCPK